MTRAFVFPGQGSQSIGMGKGLAESFPAARAVFDEVDEALGQSLSRLMFEGDEGELTLTANAQPALMAVSLAVIAVLKQEAGLDLARDAAFVAGHSLGEYSALAAAGALALPTTAKLLRLRGQAMQRAVKVGEGAMAAFIGVEPALAAEIASEAAEAGLGTCDVANDNGGGQVVVSGAKAAVDRAIEIAKGRGVKRAVLLPVSAPFHCSMMRPAAEAMAEALAGVAIAPPVVPLVANVLASPTSDPAQIRDLLVRQVTGTVRWRESIAYMADRGVTVFVECGSGKVLSGLVRRIAENASGLTVGTPADIEAYKEKAAL